MSVLISRSNFDAKGIGSMYRVIFCVLIKKNITKPDFVKMDPGTFLKLIMEQMNTNFVAFIWNRAVNLGYL